MSLLYAFGKKPTIAAVRKPCDVNLALESQVDNLFFMGGNVKEIIEAVRLTKDTNKGAFDHVDLIRGLSNMDKETVDFIADYVQADGIVTPKIHLIKEAKRAGLYGILHLFILDSLALVNSLKLAQNIEPDGIELMPGTIPKIIREFSDVVEDILQNT
ncbi:glycerol-3-phosphate responsive antiterminator [Paenibacillus filicis]|uniref:Glycerol-3-phosphate responsive antiterminator n=1 Tax=Paenibacillus gyeongsangnamensis TaxID=3388067 RepID=A0ABT4QAL8_9BACL|nr:glycerol-3-phosphate responsive antiterminator [Paenibacillus filicis]MCZ8513883.1 glycerol-3-phosphate responsive antiterminator [Paenibacillus filicis]